MEIGGVSGDLIAPGDPSSRLRLCFQNPDDRKLIDLYVEPDLHDDLAFALMDRECLEYAKSYGPDEGLIKP